MNCHTMLHMILNILRIHNIVLVEYMNAELFKANFITWQT